MNINFKTSGDIIGRADIVLSDFEQGYYFGTDSGRLQLSSTPLPRTLVECLKDIME